MTTITTKEKPKVRSKNDKGFLPYTDFYGRAPLPILEDKKYLGTGKLKGKTAIILGGSGNIGSAVAISFAKEGAQIALSSFEAGNSEITALERVHELGQHAFAMHGDISSILFIKALVQKVIAAYGRIDIIVNNIGEQHVDETISELTQEQLDRTFRTNIFSMFYLVKAALPYLPAGASIINTTSVSSYEENGDVLDYTSSVSAFAAYTRYLSVNHEVAKKKIRVNGVAPGPLYERNFRGSLAGNAGRPLLKHSTQPYEIAPAYVFLASEDSKNITGQILHVKGKVVMNANHFRGSAPHGK